jgi:ubiquinone/menaquinone biosynthesis C-methylase UbiE
MPRRILAVYPEVDMQQLPYESDRFDLVIHSDTLEHVPGPVRALSECRRVLKPGGFCCFTIPIVVGRLTRTRSGLPPSYHGEESGNQSDYQVQTEYGSDFWAQLFEAGFTECRIVSSEFPSAQAIAARKPYP